MKVPTLILLFGLLMLNAETLRIAAASNTAYAMKALASAFEAAHPGIEIETVLGSSGKLSAQIKHGAPFDIFLSANVTYPHYLYEEGKTIGKERIYAQGAVILFSREARSFERGLGICANEEIKRIAIANPKSAPYGKAAQEALIQSGVLEAVNAKLLNAENIGQALQYALTSAELGFIAKSALHSELLATYNKEGIHWMELDAKLYSPIEQAAVLLKHAKGKKAAERFMLFLFSDEAKSILREYGYLIP